MDNIATFTQKKRQELFSQTAARKNMNPAIIEKDFWVCWALMRLFKYHAISKHIMFKGGTSLAKAFHVIERFSEDIDLVLDWRIITDENPQAERSKTQQQKWNSRLLKQAEKYISMEMKNLIQKALNNICHVTCDSQYEFIIHIHYPSVFSDKYLRPAIRLEIGPLASWVPHAAFNITPYAAEEFPEIFKNLEYPINTIKVERTFWEKVTILHKEAFRSPENFQDLRYSRHYYDLAMMYTTLRIKREAFKNIHLLNDVIQFKQKFYPSAWAHYELAKPGTLKLIPPAHVEKQLCQDYAAMRNMIFGNYPSFKEIMNTITQLEQEINKLKT